MSLKRGQTLTYTSLGKKDAYHYPCIAVWCDTPLSPGDSIRFDPYNADTVIKCEKQNRHGIVDPFMTDNIPAYTVFFMILEENCVENMTHDFQITTSSYRSLNDYDDDGCGRRGC